MVLERCTTHVLHTFGCSLMGVVCPLSSTAPAVNLGHIPTLRQAGALAKTSLLKPLQAQHNTQAETAAPTSCRQLLLVPHDPCQASLRLLPFCR